MVKLQPSQAITTRDKLYPNNATVCPTLIYDYKLSNIALMLWIELENFVHKRFSARYLYKTTIFVYKQTKRISIFGASFCFGMYRENSKIYVKRLANKAHCTSICKYENLDYMIHILIARYTSNVHNDANCFILDENLSIGFNIWKIDETIEHFQHARILLQQHVTHRICDIEIEMI